MKKKFLALALAAAVMAPTTSAFAQTVGGNDTETLDANVTINGTVRNGDGTTPAGRIEVELPTATAFMVDQAGNFTGSTFTVTNRSVQAVKLLVGSFSEGNPDGGITIKNTLTTGNDQLDTDVSKFGRDNIRLQMSATADGQNQTIDLDSSVSNTDLVDIPANDTASVSILGLAGTDTTTNSDSEVETSGLAETFTLKFKIKKA